jgi:hypothetical protein
VFELIGAYFARTGYYVRVSSEFRSECEKSVENESSMDNRTYACILVLCTITIMGVDWLCAYHWPGFAAQDLQSGLLILNFINAGLERKTQLVMHVEQTSYRRTINARDMGKYHLRHWEGI